MTSIAPFADDEVGAVLGVLEQAGRALSAAEVKQALRAAGVEPDAVDRSWPRLRNAA